MIYLNAASHGLPDRAVRDRMRAYLDREDEIGPAAAEAEAAEEIAAVPDKIARIIGAPPGNVVLVGTTTIGWNAAVLALPLAGRRVLVAPGEWASDVAVLRRKGARVEVMPTAPDGGIDVDALAARIDADVAALSAPMVCSLTGERYPVEAIGALPRPDDCVFIVDGAQAVGQVPVSVSAIGCDILAATTRKWLRGPRDTAFLYVGDRVFGLMEANPAPRNYGIACDHPDFADQPGVRRFGSDSGFAPQRLGLGVALDHYLADPEAAMARPAALGTYARQRAEASGIRFVCPEARATAFGTIRLAADEIEGLRPKLTAEGIACAFPPPACEPLRPAEVLQGAYLRISPHAYNTEADIDRFFEVIETLS